MTKPRDPLSFAAAIHDVATAIGMKRAAHIVGRSVRTVQHWTESDRQGTPTLDQALALDKAFVAAGGGSAPISECFARQMEIVRVDASACPLALAEDIALVSRESGDAISHCVQALRPGATPTEIRDAIAETEQVDAAIPRLLGRLHALLPGTGAAREATGENR